jgi:hypothetical protein
MLIALKGPLSRNRRCWSAGLSSNDLILVPLLLGIVFSVDLIPFDDEFMNCAILNISIVCVVGYLMHPRRRGSYPRISRGQVSQ